MSFIECSRLPILLICRSFSIIFSLIGSSFASYCIFVYKGIIEEQKEYLRRYDWNFFSNEEQKEQYLDDIIEYGFYFIAAHEHAHIFCGHLDVRLTEPNELIAEECEADTFSIDYLMKYIQFIHPIENITEEVEKLFLAVYFLFENMQRQNFQEFYNDKLMQNYYDPDRIQKRDHPLDAQRILYLYDMLNIVVITDSSSIFVDIAFIDDSFINCNSIPGGMIFFSSLITTLSRVIIS